MSIAENLHKINSDLPESVKLIAVSKFHPAEAIIEAYQAGQKVFGESRMQEIDKKHLTLPQDIEWHFIGHLQTNKVKSIIPYVHTIHSIDSWKLLSEIEKQATISNRRICCLLEIHIAQEEAKYGLSYKDCIELLDSSPWRDCQYAYIGGVMGMATYTENEEQIRAEFKKLKSFFDEVKENYFPKDNNFKEVSMGMSGDYKIAVEEGSTMVRIGSSIFGNREY
ncbi:MAG: YggS family pyridoxal phosphate-dependent enzyme [Dysgonomonas sp.]|nr:YggS family pyridoxal phosphate-dependent enzyme [Dysgonomonas sp.]